MQIGCSTYSFRNEFSKKSFTFDQNGFKIIKQQFPQIKGWEVNHEFLEQYWKTTDPNGIKSFKQMLNQLGFEWFGLTIPSGSMPNVNLIPFYHDYPSYIKGFERDVDFRLGFTQEWIENASVAGVKLMRIDCGPFVMNHKINYSMAFDFNIAQNVAIYRQICSMAKEYEIQVGIENHGGFTSDPKVLRKLLNGVPELKFTFDIGNVTDSERYKMAAEFADRINFCHLKTYVFNPNGEETYMDVGRIIGILKDKGFDGWLSIEFEGPESGIDGVEKTIRLIQKSI